MEIHRSARKHGIADAEIRHAVRQALFVGDLPSEDVPPWKTLHLGPDRAGNLIEVISIALDDGREIVIHAMRMRREHQSLLLPPRVDQ